MKQKDQKGIRGDGKELLKDESGKESGKRISSVPVEALVEGIGKDRRDELMDIEMFFQKLEMRVDGI